jgi:dipeptide transport system ATP-binding protein
MVPGVDDRPAGCLFSPRCAYADDRCRRERPALTIDSGGGSGSHPAGDLGDRAVRCLKPLDAVPAPQPETTA